MCSLEGGCHFKAAAGFPHFQESVCLISRPHRRLEWVGGKVMGLPCVGCRHPSRGLGCGHGWPQGAVFGD